MNIHFIFYFELYKILILINIENIIFLMFSNFYSTEVLVYIRHNPRPKWTNLHSQYTIITMELTRQSHNTMRGN